MTFRYWYAFYITNIKLLHDTVCFTYFSHKRKVYSFTSTSYLFYLLSAEMLQFLAQMRNRFFNIIKTEMRTDSDAGWVCRSRRNRERLETLHRRKDTIETPAKNTEAFDRNEVFLTDLFIRSLYLEEMDVIVCVWKLLQLSVSPPQIFNLLLQSLQLFFSSTHFSLFLISDHLCHLRAPSLNGADQISKDLLTVLHCCLCRALLGHTEREASESVHSLSSYCWLTACSPQWASVGLKELQHWLLTDWLKESPN